MLENLTMGYENVSMAEVVKAVNLVGLSDFINRLPEGYHTVLTPQGLHLSSSIVTKIKMARCFISKPSLITIEESFAFLEKEDRAKLIECLTDKNSPWTLIAVTDDPFFAARCDRVAIMDGGKIVAEGNFETIRKTGHFLNVFKTLVAD
jgi:ABC-type multidrug transport system fused ATPase/permease subunit